MKPSDTPINARPSEFMDNRIFNVNGNGSKMLLAALELVFDQCGDNTTCAAFKYSIPHGLILLWHYDKNYSESEICQPNPMPARLTAIDALPFVRAWLESDEAKQTKCEEWDAAASHGGSNSPGWRVYCEDWGKVSGYSAAICAIKPVTLWYGK